MDSVESARQHVFLFPKLPLGRNDPGQAVDEDSSFSFPGELFVLR